MQLSSISLAITRLVGGLFTPRSMFAIGINGAWYDPSDLTTLYQDAAGTVPVTAVEQPVGRILDKSGRGNHAFNPSGNSANFPVLSARVNLLTKTEDFSDAGWVKSNFTVTSDYAVAPNGTTTADGLQSSGLVASLGRVGSGVVSGVQYVFSFYVISNTGQNQEFRSQYGATIQSNTATTSWTKITFQVTWAGFSTIYPVVSDVIGSPLDISIWGASLVPVNQANLPYQRVNTASDYDTVGFPQYLRFNGVNQWLQTNSIDFSYGDKMFVCAGVRKLSDSAVGVVAEISTGDSIGVFNLYSPPTATPSFGFRSKGTTGILTTASGYVAPITSMLSGIGDISGDKVILRANGSQASISTIDQGAGNYGSYPLYIGARAGTSLFFNGRLYGMVIAGKQASAAEIANTEFFLNQRTGAY